MLKRKDLLSVYDLSMREIEAIFALTQKLKKKNNPHLLQGKTLGMIFEKSSTRTRVSFEVGMLQLGGHAIFLSSRDIQIGRGETVEDTARVLSAYLDGVVMRTYSHQEVVDFARRATIPVINGLTDYSHPVQVLCDLYTIFEIKGRIKPLKVVYVGDGSNNMAHSWLFAAAKCGMELTISAPSQYHPHSRVMELALGEAKKSGARILLEEDPKKAVRNADVLYTDTWVSMGQEAEERVRLKTLAPYQVNCDLLQGAKKEAVVMHCLPAHRGEEISADVVEGKQSVIFHQAANRLHVQKAILAMLLGRGKKGKTS